MFNKSSFINTKQATIILLFGIIVVVVLWCVVLIKKPAPCNIQQNQYIPNVLLSTTTPAIGKETNWEDYKYNGYYRYNVGNVGAFEMKYPSSFYPFPRTPGSGVDVNVTRSNKVGNEEESWFGFTILSISTQQNVKYNSVDELYSHKVELSKCDDPFGECFGLPHIEKISSPSDGIKYVSHDADELRFGVELLDNNTIVRIEYRCTASAPCDEDEFRQILSTFRFIK